MTYTKTWHLKWYFYPSQFPFNVFFAKCDTWYQLKLIYVVVSHLGCLSEGFFWLNCIQWCIDTRYAEVITKYCVVSSKNSDYKWYCIIKSLVIHHPVRWLLFFLLCVWNVQSCMFIIFLFYIKNLYPVYKNY